MAFKFVAFFAFIAAASAGILPLEHHQQYDHHYDHHDQHDHHAHHALTTVEHHALPVEHHAIPVEHHHAPVYHSAPVTTHVAAPQHHVLLQKHHHEHEHEQYPDDPHPQYNFAYDVKDAVSGDSKSQTESRDGDVVHGEYSLNDADGFRRTVKYTADSVNGFNAVVHREPLAHKVVTSAAVPVQYHHAAAAVVKAPVAYTAPAYTSHAAHHEQQHPTYTTYELPSHHDNQHQYQYHH